jgi:hypothetical protein
MKGDWHGYRPRPSFHAKIGKFFKISLSEGETSHGRKISMGPAAYEMPWGKEKGRTSTRVEGAKREKNPA